MTQHKHGGSIPAATDDERVLRSREMAMRQAVAKLAKARRRLDDQQALLQDQAAVAATALREYGAELHDAEARVPSELLHALYWDHLDLSVQDIATAFDIRSNELHRHAGTHEQPAACKGCGVTVTRSISKRSAANQHIDGRRGRDWRYCAPCRERVDKEREADEAGRREWVRAEEIRMAEEAAQARRDALRDGRYRVHEVKVVEYDYGFGFRDAEYVDYRHTDVLEDGQSVDGLVKSIRPVTSWGEEL